MDQLRFSRRLVFAATVLSFAVGAVAGCSYESGLDDSECTQGEFTDAGGIVCRGGYRVKIDTGTASDVEPETDGCLPSSEVCNGKDDDCDGEVDEGIDCSCDYDDTSEGVCGDARKNADGECQRPPAYNESEVQCQDGRDNDCDGDVDGEDADCQCTGDETRPCYTGPDTSLDDANKGKGICERGIQTCRRGLWGACEDEVTPVDGEICSDDKDNDCDGVVNGGCDCIYDPGDDRNIDSDSSNNAGVCTAATIEGDGNGGSVCGEPGGFITEDDEGAAGACDGVDNDCDGTVDEGCDCVYDPSEPKRVDSDQSHASGVCQNQSINSAGECERPSTFETRTSREDNCDGQDNDCDGDVDEGCECVYDPMDMRNIDQNGSNNSGVCVGSVLEPGQGGNPSTCAEPQQFTTSDDEASAGLCDGRDNDCDGEIDENCSCIYDPNEPNQIDTDGSHGAGICKNQTRGGPMGNCQKPNGFVKPQGDSEAVLNACGNGTDDDCDGVVEDGCTCEYDPTESRNIDTDGDHGGGVCQGETIDQTGACTRPANYEETPGDAESGTSCIDGDDNDCDGTADEFCPCVYDHEDTDNIDGANGDNANGVCLGQTLGSSGNTCQKPSEYIRDDDESGAGKCDFLDNDCDGAIDEGCPCFYNGKSVGVCRDAKRSASGTCTDSDIPYSNDEVSSCDDGKDNDCDGTVDEATKRAGKGCSKDCECYSGICNNGTCGHRIFVTDVRYDGSLGGLSGADGKCRTRVNSSNADLTGPTSNWKAVLSAGSKTAKNRLNVRATVHEMSTGDLVASGSSDLWDGSIQDDINITALGTQVSCTDVCDDVWTGTTFNNNSPQVASNTCNDWSSSNGDDKGRNGESDDTGASWVDDGDRECDLRLRLYCIDGQ